MLLTNIDHVAIAVKDLEAAIAYYREAFGAEVHHREIVESDGVEEARHETELEEARLCRRTVDLTGVSDAVVHRVERASLHRESVHRQQHVAQDGGGGRDRVGAVEQVHAGLMRGGDHAQRRGLVARDVAVPTGLELRGRHGVGVLEDLRGLAEVVARLERREVRVVDHLVLAEPLVDPAHDGVDGAGVHPRDEAEREEVLRPLGVAGLGPGVLGRLERQRRHRDRVQPVRGQRAVLERVRRVAGLLQVRLDELGAAQIGAREGGTRHVGAGEVGVLKTGAREIGAREVRGEEIGARGLVI